MPQILFTIQEQQRLFTIHIFFYYTVEATTNRTTTFRTVSPQSLSLKYFEDLRGITLDCKARDCFCFLFQYLI